MDPEPEVEISEELVSHMVPACHVHWEKNATTRVWWTHEGRKKTALLCDECVAKIADIITDARRLQPEELEP